MDSLNTLLKSAWCEDYEKAAGFAGEIAPAVAGTLWNRYACAGRDVEHFMLTGGAIETGDEQ